MAGFDEPAPASGNSVDEVLQGFEDSAAPATTTKTPPQDDAPWQLSGATTLSTTWSYAHQAPAPGATDYRGLSRLRGKLNLEVDGQLSEKWRTHLGGYTFYDAAYALNGRAQYSSEFIDAMQSEAELGEAFVQGRLHRALDVKVGRQIVVWGKSDSLRVTDVLNPLDNREPGMVDIEDLRLPLTMARGDLYLGDWGFTALVIPEIRFNKNPAWGSDFYPTSQPSPPEITPDDGSGNNEYAFAANGVFRGWDLSLYWAQLYDDTAHGELVDGQPRLLHSRLTMNGLAANLALGNWLVKGEAARFSGVEYSAVPASHNRTDVMLGTDYSGLTDTTLSLEVVNRRITDYDSALQSSTVAEEEWQTALRYQGDFLHARLHLIALASAFGKQLDEGSFTRLSAGYDLADALSVTGGVISYEGGKKFPFDAIADNDRLFVDVKYSF
ncbi:MAG TPA: DUF1302 family protein [Gammaproteobacteria bacterium]